jgi:hypothetical protein
MILVANPQYFVTFASLMYNSEFCTPGIFALKTGLLSLQYFGTVIFDTATTIRGGRFSRTLVG